MIQQRESNTVTEKGTSIDTLTKNHFPLNLYSMWT